LKYPYLYVICSVESRITDFGLAHLNWPSTLLTAVAFLCFPTYYVRCRQCTTAHIWETDSDTALVSRFL